MNKILKLSMVLFLICAVTAGILGVVNALTWERIDQITHQKEYEAYAEVLPSSSGYTAVEFDKAAFPTVDSVNQSNDGNGYVVTSTFSGAQGSITMACGVGTDLKSPVFRSSSTRRLPVSVPWRPPLPMPAWLSAASLSDRTAALPFPRQAVRSMRWPARRSLQLQ